MRPARELGVMKSEHLVLLMIAIPVTGVYQLQLIQQPLFVTPFVFC